MRYIRIKIILLALLSLLALSACGVKTVYNNLDWVLEGMVEDYVNLTDQQELDVEQRVAMFMKWHRKTQLQEYVNDLKKIKVYSKQGFDDESTEIIFENFMKRWGSLKHRIAPDMVDILLSLNDEQVKELFVSLEEENQEILAEINDTTAEEKLEKSKEKLISNFSDWLGPLTEEQKQLLRSWPPRFKPLDQDRMVFRKNWQNALMRVLLGEFPSYEKREKLMQLVTTPDEYQTAEHKAKLVYNSKQVKELMLTFDQTVTNTQKQYLAERLDTFIVAFEELIAEGSEESL
ncbi:MAG: DUF6279 family lipoprotein [Thioalkalispiraceae bacterium]|jgi:hypothetical protein